MAKAARKGGGRVLPATYLRTPRWSRRTRRHALLTGVARYGRRRRRRRGHAKTWRSARFPAGEFVAVHITLPGGGFGRKSKHDFAIEAAVLSQQMGGRPVKVVWTREDDLHHDFFHTVSVEGLHAGLDAQGGARVAPSKRAHPHAVEPCAGWENGEAPFGCWAWVWSMLPSRFRTGA